MAYGVFPESGPNQDVATMLYDEQILFDVMRDPRARVLYDKLDTQSKQQLPLLYHRESRQSVFGLTDKNRVRAWAKGRWLSGDYKPTLPAEFFSVTEEDGDELEEEMMMEDDANVGDVRGGTTTTRKTKQL